MSNWIKWNGIVEGGGAFNQSIPGSTEIEWGDNPYTWGDVKFVSDIADGVGTGRRRERQERLDKLLKDEEKKKKLIRLICRVDGKKVYDETKEMGTTRKVTVDEVDMLIERVLGKMRVKDVI